MSTQILQLDQFFLTRLTIKWHGPNDGGTTESGISCDYDVLQHKEKRERFRIAFRFRVFPADKDAPAGYEIDSEIVGFFTAPKEWDSENKQILIRFNGGLILYGILRGQVALATGSFAGGKFNLPTLDMSQVVAEIEAKRTGPAIQNVAEDTETYGPRRRKRVASKASS